MWTQDSIDKVLKGISMGLPENLRKAIYKEDYATPTMMMVVDKALEDPNLSEEKKSELQYLKDLGTFDKKRLIEDPKIRKMVDEYTNREIKKAVKDGRLPGKKKLKELQILWKEQKKTS